jgi:hypothetical protein
VADNITFQATTLATPPVGTPVRTKDRAGIATQVVALDLGGSGAETLMAGRQSPARSRRRASRSPRAPPPPAKQPALGTAGAASADVLTVQGVASMTPLKVDGSGVTQPVSGTVAFSNASLAVTNAGTFAVQAAQSGTWNVGTLTTITNVVHVDDNGSTLSIDDGGGSITVDGTVAVTGTFWQATQPVSIAATVTVTGAGGTFPVTDSGGSLTVDAPVGTPVFVRLSDGTSAIATLPVSIAATVGTNLASYGGSAVGATNALHVQPGTGAVFAASQSGTWNVGTVTTVSTVTNLSQLGGAAIAMGTGARSAGTQRVTIATDDVVPCSQSGTWNVGTVTTVTTVSAVTAISNALPAGTNLLGKVSSGLDTSTINNGTTALTPKFALIAASSSGDNTVVAAVTSKKIRVLNYRSSPTAPSTPSSRAPRPGTSRASITSRSSPRPARRSRPSATSRRPRARPSC